VVTPPLELSPLDPAASQLTVASPDPGATASDLGAVGAPIGVTASDPSDGSPLPALFVAATVKVYDVPPPSPVNVQDVAVVVVQVWSPGCAVTVYPMIGEPPLLVGAVQLTVAPPGPELTWATAGVPGGDAGVTLGDGGEDGPVPTPFVAVTENPYELPSVSPTTVQVVAGEVAEQLEPPGSAVTV
jgi:hypothetical protein